MKIFFSKNNALLYLLGLCLFITLVKLLFIASPAMPRTDDVYYYRWSQDLMLSYPDHPPMIGYLVGLSIWLFGKTTIAIELLGYILYILLAILCYLLAMRNPIFLKKHRTVASILLAVSLTLCPYFAGISVIMSPDTPLMFFGIISLLLYGDCFLSPHSKPWKWLLAGVLLALAFLSKLTFFFPAASLLLYAIFSKKRKHYFKNTYFYLSFTPIFVVGLLMLYSDYTHQFMMLRYSAARAERPFFIYDFIGFWFSQFVLQTPFFVPLFYFLPIKDVVYYFKKLHKQHPLDDATERLFFLGMLSFPSLLYIVISSTTTFLGSYWSSFAYIGGLLLTVNFLAKHWHKKTVKIITLANFSLAFIYLCFVPLHTMFGVEDPNYKGAYKLQSPTISTVHNQEILETLQTDAAKIPSKISSETHAGFWEISEHGWFNSYNLLLAKFSTWSLKNFNEYPVDNTDAYHIYNSIKNIFRDYHREELNPNYPILTDSYGLAALIFFLLPNKTDVYELTAHNSTLQLPQLKELRENGYERFSFYDIIFNEQQVIGKDVYLILQFNDQITNRRKGLTDTVNFEYEEILNLACTKFSLIKSLYSYRFQKQVGQFFVFECNGYKKSNH